MADQLTLGGGLGAQISVPPPGWGMFSAPAVSVQASAVKAAIPGFRHVCTGVSFGFSATSVVVLAAVTVNLRDGVSGAGTILQSWQFGILAGTILPTAFSFQELNIAGTSGNAMTLEFSALLSNLLQFVNLSGYDTV